MSGHIACLIKHSEVGRYKKGRKVLEFAHVTVLLKESVNLIIADPSGTYVDCTLGGAGHTRLILNSLTEQGRLIAFDQDPKAIVHAEEMLGYDRRLTLIKSNFTHLEEKLREINVLSVDGILFDIGVSSPQLDEAERGFSYMQDAPLDMRMNPEQELTAHYIVNHWREEKLAEIIWSYGEERWSKRIAQFVTAARNQKPINTTGDLVEIIKAAVPAGARREGPHPAKRTFQALRIAVNDELGVLDKALDQALECLAPGGRVGVITFHSLEDRIVKEKMQMWLGRCTCPPEFPVCKCNSKARAKLITRKPLPPSEEEIAQNPRARSAKLRVAEKIG